ncbi:MAG: hypothetical protein M0Q53_01210 [Prolixibacteraceae bacterium]|nr:hypothetical protein [Prolixibacteraceae bacterium]
MKIAILFLLLTVGSFTHAFGQTNTWDGSSSSNWNTAANWSLNLVPTAAHNVVIPNGITSTITVNTAAVCNSFTINGGGTANTVSISGTNSLTVTNGVSIGAGTGSGDNKILAVGTGSLSCSSITVTAAGSSNRISGVTLSTGTVTVTGNITMGNANDDFTFSGAGTLNVGGTWTGGTFTASTGTVNYNGTAQTLKNATTTYYNLILSGSGNKTFGNSTTISGTLTVQNGATALINNTIAANGPTLVDGTLSVNTTTGTKTFTGDVTINNGGTWNETVNEAITFAGNLTNNGTWSITNTTAHTFSGSGKTIGGNNEIAILSVAVPGTYTNSGTLTVGTALTGAGGLTNDATGTLNLSGTGASCSITTLTNAGTINRTNNGTTTTPLANFTNTGTINLNGSGSITGITNNAGGIVNLSSSGTITSFNNATATSTLNISTTPTVPTITTLTATVTGNTVNYSGAGNQTVKATAYSNLTISGNGTKTLAAATPTVNGVLTVNAGTTLALSTFALGGTTAPTSIVMEIGTTGSVISGSGALNLGGDVAVNYITGSSGATISCPISLDGNLTFTVADDGTSATDLTISGVMALGTGTGWGITKAGLGTLLLSGLNTYTGPTSINEGTLALGISSASATSGPLGNSTGGTTVSAGAVLDLNGFSLSSAATEPITLNGTGLTASPAGALTNNSATTASTYAGAITLGSASSIGTVSNITLGTGGITGSMDLEKIGAATLNLGSGPVSLANLTITAGTLTSTSNTVNLSGNFTNNSTFTHNIGTVNFNGSTAQTIGGSVSSTFNNLTIANTSGGVSLTKNETVSGILTLSNGILGTDATNVMAVSNTSGSAVTGSSASSYVNGPLEWSLLSGNSYLFPVGDAANYRPFELNSVVCASPVVRVTMASTGAGSVDGTLSSVDARNWFAQIMSGTSTSATVRLTESGLTNANTVASATAAQAGPYTDQGGNSIAGGTITSNAAIPYSGSTYFAVGSRPPAVSLSDNGTQIAAANVVGGTNNVVLHHTALAVAFFNANLTGMTCTTAGSYVSADITNLKVWYQTTGTFNAGTATLLSTLTTPGISGAKTFPTFTSQSITSGTTGYIFITADVAPSAVVGHTININALTTSDFTFTLATKSGSTTAGGAQTVVPGPLDHFAISTITSPQTAGTAITGITLTAQDVNNNTVTSFVSSVAYSGTAGITGTSAAFTAGVLSGVSVTPTVAGTSMTFIVTGATKTGTSTFNVNPGALDHFAISTITSPQTAGTAITGITLTAQDINNNTATSFVSTVTYSGTAGITGTSAAFTAGVLSGVSVTPTVAGTSMTFIVTGATKTGTSTFNVNPGAVDHFVISAISSPQTAGTAITGITITAQDINNNTATGFVSTVTYSGTAGITGTSAAFTSGVLSGVSVTPNVSGTSLTFIVTGSTKTGMSTFNVNPGALDHFAISTISSPQTAGTAITGITLTAQDVNNNTATSFVSTVTYSGTAGITGTSAAFTAGVLSGVSVTPTVAGTSMTFIVTGSTKTGTSTFNVNPGALDHFAISTITSPQTSGIAITGITLTAQDVNNNTATGFVSTVTYSGTAGITGTSAAFTAGVLSGVSVTPTAVGTSLTFIVTGSTKTGTSTFNVDPGAVDHFIISAISSPQTAGTAITGITITAQDVNNNTATGFVSTVSYSGTAGITSTSAAFTSGVLTGVSVTPTVAGTSVTFIVTGSTKTGTSTFNVNPGALDHFAISTITSPQTAGTAITGITLTAQDINNNTATSFVSTVTYSGTAGITGTSAAFTAGVLSGVSVTPTAVGTSLTFIVTGSTKTGTSTFNVDPGAVDHFIISAISSPQTAGTAITGITITAQDVNNNTATGFVSTVTYSGTAGITGASAAFTAGVLSAVSVTPTVAGTSMTFIVTGATKTGTSTFNVNPGALDHFAISTISSPQSAGTAITGITLTAQDVNNNTATSFISTVTYSGTAGITGTSAAFTAGVLSGVSVTPTVAGTSMTFIVTGSTKSGTSTFNVNPGAATQIAINSGNGQSATAGTAVAVPPSVIVKDFYNNPVSGVAVTFAVASGGGSGTGLSATTNASGIATVGSWTLGTLVGANSLTATSSGLTGSPLTFTATGTAGAATQMAMYAGNGQSATAGSAVAIPPSVVVKDINNNVVSGVSVTFAVASGGGSGTGLAATTNASGIATVGSWTLGITAGTNTLTATSTGLTGSPLTFTATGTAGAATQIAINAGDAQSATVGNSVATQPSVIVRDANNNPVNGVAVTFAVATGGGSATGLNTTTNASGIAIVNSWTLGTTAGTNTLTATSGSLTGSPVTFTATGTAGVATQIAINAGDGQSATIGTTVAIVPSVIVKDVYNNPVSGVSVTFAVASGGGSGTGLAATTDASGIASVGSWTLGATAGTNTLTATSGTLIGSPLTFTATGTPVPPIVSTAAGGDWATGSTWVGGIAPTATDVVVIATTGGNAATTNGGTITCAGLTINSGAVLTMRRPFNVNGPSDISGRINFGSTSTTVRAMAFNGNVTLNSGSIWDETNGGANTVLDTYTFAGDLTNNATTFTSLTGSPHTFSGTGMNLNGSALTSISNAAVTGTYTNNGTFTVSTALTGAGSLTNSVAGTLNIDGSSSITTLANAGTVTITNAGAISTVLANFTNTGTLNLNGSGTITGITNNASGIINLSSSGTITNLNNATATSTLNISATPVPAITTLTATAAGNLVNYNGVAQTIKATTYSNLTLSGTGGKTFPTGATTVNNILSIENGANANTFTGTLAYGTNATLQYNTTSNRNASTEWITPFTATGGVVIANTGAITMNASKVFDASVPLTVNSGATLNMSTFSLTLNGDLINNGGTVSGTSGGVVITGTTAQNIGAFTTTGTVSMTKTGGTATFTGNVSGAGLTINGTGGTLSLGSGLTHTFSGTWTRTAGTLDAGSSTLNLSATGTVVSGTGGTFTAGTGTVNYSGAGTQNIAVLTYNNLELSGGGGFAKTFTANTTINGNLSIANSTIANLGTGLTHPANSLTLGGAGQVAGTWGGTGSAATNINTTYFTATTGIVNVSSLGAPTSISATPASINFGDTGTISLAASGGGGSGATLTWYAGGCGSGTSIGTGSPLVINKPAVTTTYYARWESGLIYSSCLSTTVTVLNTTFYSYQSGDWNTANTWTTDPSGSFWVNGGIPASTDHVVILNGRTITVNENGKVVNSLEIRLGGTLDLQTTTTHNFGTVTGDGILKLASGNFPGGTYTGFVAANGGTVEYYNLNNQSISSTQLTYNKLIVSNYTASANTTYLDNTVNNINYTVNGNFDLNNHGAGSLTFNFGNPSPSDNLINMSVAGNFTVASGCSIGVNNFASAHTIATSDVNPSVVNPVHSLTLYGNFTNNGSVRFTGLPAPFDNAYYLLATTAFGGTNYGDVQVTFAGATNNTVTCNGTTDFFRFIVEKGSDQTYTLDVNSSNVANFALYGPDNQGNNNFAGYGYYYKALFLHYGTLKLNSNISIPSISEGGQDFLLNPSACLWVNGANVSTTVSGLNGTGYQAATFYGRLRVSAGQFSTGDAAGIVLGDLSTPEINIEGTGTLDVSQVWNNTGATNLISYTQTGGTANFRLLGENHAGAVLSLDNPNTVFNMSGGVINFTENSFTGGGTDFRLFNIQVLPGKFSITGGTINVNVPSSATVYTGNTTVPFYNMNISNRTGSGTVILRVETPGSNLTILNDLSIGNGAILDLNTNTIGLEVDRNFSLVSGATYTPGANTTTFNGSGAQTLTNTGTITSGLNNFTLSNASNTSITNDLTIRGTLTINSGCILHDQGFTISAAGNIVNSGTHSSQANGSILLNGTLAQTIGGSGTGLFGNLGINKSSGATTFQANQTVNGNLRLANGILDITSFNLKFSATSAIYDAMTGTSAPTTFGDTKMIKASGDQSAGGITKSFSAIGSFLYPFGTTTYHPATIDISQAPTHWGDVTVKPVAFVHPSVDPTKNALAYYWKVISSSFTGIQPGSISHTYHYITADVAGNDNTYITGVYRPVAWTKGDALQVDIIGKNIYFPAIQYLDGEYTAGETNAFGTVKVYYSRANGDWDTPATWSLVSNADGTSPGTIPGPSDLVVIGDGGSNNHLVTISANTKIISGLQINTGSTLDVNTTTGHVFGTVTGTGKLRISSSTATAVFPSGDFGDFLGTAGGTVEYYTETAPGNIGTAFTLPTSYLVGSNPINIATYYNLILSPATGKNITLPNTDLLIYNDLNISVSGTSLTGISQINNQNIPRTVTVNGNLNVNNGNLQFTNGSSTAQFISVIGNVNVASGAIFDVAANLAATNTLAIQGNLTNNGTFDMIAGAAQVCNVTFTGAASKQIGGTTATRTDFNTLTINKGTDRTSIMEATVNAMTLNSTLATAMTITNGTFRLSNSNVSLTLSTTNAFTIPSSGCLSANLGTMNVGAANNNGSDLLLLGKLEIMNTGTVNVGNNSGSHNDIEYAASGSPEINISGGSLNVDGQVRRNLANTLGSLIYNQSGGNVTVKGNSFDATRSMFEVLNAGSQFNVTGGTLTIVKAGSTNADFYLDPGSYVVNSSNGGHTVTIGNSSTAVAQNFKINTMAPLWNVTVDGTTTNKTATLSINPISILYNLTINGNGNAGTGSVFKANDLNVTIGGSLINNNLSSATGTNVGGYQTGVAATSTQATTFTGTGNITGTGSNLTNFANLVIGSLSTTPSITLGSSSNIRVNTNLTITSGTLADAANTITAMGDISNAAIHSSSSSSGGMLLANSTKQTITTSGSGKFGNITLNNAGGADIIGDSWITGQLTLTSGLLYINDYKLVMDINSTFGGTYDVNRMIMLNGANSDKGVEKYFSGSASNFIFPTGSTGKYRPVTFTFTSANPGSITVVPVNTAHPSDFAPTTDQLNYYWKTTVTGFSGVSAVTQVYQYGTAEVTGTESNYISARFSSSLWVQYGAGTINATNHTITINDLFTGEYTAGEIANFGLVHTLYTIASGNWNSTAIWAEDAPTNPSCNCYPLGNPVFIQPGHTVTMNINGASAASVDIQGTFDLKQSINHSLGSITDTTHAGTGKMMIENSPGGMFVFPGGNYDRFMASTGTTVELYGSIDAQMPLKPGNLAKPYQNLILTGTGIKYMSADVTKILGNLTINNGAKLSAALHNMPLYILNNWSDYNIAPSSGGFVPGTGSVSFEGGTAQTMTISSGAVTENFYDFIISNPAGVTIAGGGNVQIANNLTLSSGTITTNSTNSLTLTNVSSSAVIGGSVGSYINGPLRKQISNGSFFTFPLGKSSPSPRYGQVYLSGVVTSGVWEAEYFNNSPNSNSPSLTITNMLSPVASVSNNEYWRVRGVGSGSANATLRWDANSGYHLSTPSDRSKIRVVEWVPSNSRWENRGNVVTDNGPDDGLVTTDAAIALADGTDLHYLTIGGGSLPLPTASITSPLTAAICNDNVASTTVTVTLTGTAPWSLTYQLGSATTTLSNIASSPVSIVLTSGSSGITQPITTDTNFNFHITNVNDFNGVAGNGDYSTAVVITVHPMPDNTITGRTQVGINEVVAYTTPTDANTYAWTLSSNGTPLTGNTSTYTVTWGTNTPGPYTIGLTKTTTAGCQSVNSISVTTSTTPTPVITGNQKVCTGSTETYSTPLVSGHSYAWSLSGNGVINSGAATNSISVTWGVVSINNSVSVVESITATPAIQGSASKTVDIGIQPTTNPTYSGPSSVCVGVGPVFTINNSELNVRYQLRNNADNSNSGLFVDGTGGTITLTGSPIVTNTVYNIYGYTLAPFTCSVQLTGTVSVTSTPWGSWVGGTSIDWNTASNWSCGQIPGISINVSIGTATNYPTLNGGSVGTANNLSIGSGASLTVTGNTLQIAGTISNSGTFTASNGTIEMMGSSAQTISANTFAGSTIASLTVNNSAGVTLTGALNVTDIVKATLGNLASNGNLTLKSSASQTALIDGSGAGTVTGSVTMERYLPSAYGYKYLSSPFTSASLAATLSGNATIPTFYAYNEDNSTIILGVTTYISGWVTTGVAGLSPMVGYSANFGNGGNPQTFSMTGSVNDGSMSATLYNHNRTYTLGFNLVGNPYPSPINWNLGNRTNVDNAIYFFNASGAADQYSGVYDSYINGVSSGGSTNIIPSMQGFFVHVTSTGSGSLDFSNAMRTTDLNPTYKAAKFDPRPIMRFSASYDQKNALMDAYVIYLDNKTSRKFDPEYDALKLMNTDVTVPNIYEIAGNSQNLSISGMPEPVDSLTRIPIGIKALKEGWMNIAAVDLSKLPVDLTIYLEDKSNNIHQDLRKEPKYRFYANQGDINNRFALVMAMVGYNYSTANPEKLFTLSKIAGTLLIRSNLPEGNDGLLRITNMLGQTMLIKSITFNQTIEIGADWQSGIYVVTLVSGGISYSEKTIIRRK